ncbi:MAG: hypothetical protein V4773_01335 [Verrucomicrobiota bacterium]
MTFSLLLRLGLILGLGFGVALRGIAATEAVASAQLPSKEECEEFGQWIVERFEAKELGELTRVFDALAFTQAITAGLEVADKEVLELSSGLRTGFARSFEAELNAFESAHFVRVQEKEGQRRVLIRFVSGEGAVNYIAFICARRTGGGVKWIDAFSYLTGETFGASSRRLLLPILAEKKKSLLEKLTSSENALVKNLLQMQRGLTLIRQQKHAEALALLQKLPAVLRKEKFFLLLEMRAAQALDEATYLKSLETIAAALPNDPTLDLVLLDGDFMRKDYAGALRRLASFEKEIGGDAYLNCLRANVHILTQDWPAGKKAARAALAVEPALFPAYDSLLLIAVTSKNHGEVADVLSELEANFPKMNMLEGIKDDEVYAEFRKSPAYAEWVAARGKGTPELLRKPAPSK